jgi:uncharacterized delta-60 repeat protein
MVVGTVLVGAVLTGVLIWNWSHTPRTFDLRHAALGDKPKATLRLLSRGILSIALESRSTTAAGLAQQEDGTIVVGATTWPKGANPSVYFNKVRGVVLLLTSSGLLANPAFTLLADAPATLNNLSASRDGTIALAGATNGHFLVARLLPDGVLDPAFGGGGTVLANMRASIWGSEAAHAVAIQGDDRIVATGVAVYATGPLSQGGYCATARFSRDGRFDRSFAGVGRVLTLIRGKEMCSASSVLIAPDGKIVVVVDYRSEAESGRHITVLRYLPDGAPDRRFGRDGIAEPLEEISANAMGAALDTQGRIVIVGSEYPSPTSTRLLVVRYDTDGNLDQSFGSGGIVSLHNASTAQALVATALQQDGKIVAVGHFGWHSGGRPPEPDKRNQIVVVRLDANGALDRSFAGGGLLLMASPRYLWDGDGLAIQPDGKLLILGDNVDEANDRATYGIVLVRLNQDGTPDIDFGSSNTPSQSACPSQ